MSLSSQRQHRPRRGISTIKILLALPSVAMMTWLGVEAALVVRAANQAKAAADAIALAAAARFADGHETARLDALTAASASSGPGGSIVITVSEGPAGGGDLLFGRWDEESRKFTADPDGGPAARAMVRLGGDSQNAPPGIMLPGLFQIANIVIERSSVAVYSPPRHATALHVSGGGRDALELSDIASCRSRNGLSVSSSDSAAVSIGGSSSLEAPVLRVAGGLSPASTAGVEGVIETGVDIPKDPFDPIALPQIDATSAAAIPHSEGATTLVAPGVHAALEFASGTVVLLPGLHQFTGPLTLAGNARLELDHASVQFADGVAVQLSGAAQIRGTSSTSIGAWSGFALIQRGDPTVWRASDAASIEIDGIAYLPTTRVNAVGSASLAFDAAILRSYRGSESSTLEFDGKIEELDLPFVSGRARLVR